MLSRRGASLLPSLRLLGARSVSTDLLVNAAMGWGMDSSSHEMLVGKLRPFLKEDDALVEAMSKVDRAHFCLPESTKHPYANEPQPIGGGMNMSTPQQHATVLGLLGEHLQQPGAVALDVGCGHGYLTCVMGLLASRAVGIERNPLFVLRSWEALNMVCSDGAGQLADTVRRGAEGGGRGGRGSHLMVVVLVTCCMRSDIDLHHTPRSIPDTNHSSLDLLF